MENVFKDIRYGFRMLLNKPSFTAVAALTLALGIGANTAIFSVVNAVLLRPLPYREPSRLVEIWETNPIKGWKDAPAAPANFYDWEQQNDVFEGIASHLPSPNNFTLSGRNEPERLRGMPVTGNLFSVLGVDAAFGRTFLPEETWKGNSEVVILSHSLWKRRFGEDPNIVGQLVSLDSVNYTVVGVMPSGFYFPTKETELWVPFGFDPNQISSLRRPHFLRVVARLKTGKTLEQAQTEMTTIAGRLEQQYPGTNTKMGVGLGLLHDWTVTDTRLPLLLLLGAVGFILLIACANIANLMLARAATRAREMALRTALGAGRFRLLRQLLTESLVMSAAGGALGLLLAVWGKELLLSFSPGNIPRFDEISIDASVFSFTLGISLLTTLVFGLVPALASSKIDLTLSLKEGGQKGGGDARHNRARNLFVVLEVAFALMLLIGAGLMIKSFVRLEHVDPGFDPDNLVALQISLPTAKYKGDPQQISFYQQALQRLKVLPGVSDAALALALPSEGAAWTSDFTIEGRSPDDYGKEVRHNVVSSDYFRTMRVPLATGRVFTDYDDKEHPAVVVINEALSYGFFGSDDPIGKRLKFSKPEVEDDWLTIVGVVKNEKLEGLAAEVKPEVYQTFLQTANSFASLVVRTVTDPRALTRAARSEISAVDKDVPIFNIKTMREVLFESIARERFTVLLLTIFAGVALMLSAVGIYGVMSYAVTERTHEIGIRMALGANTADVLRLVVMQGAKLALVGVSAGVAGAFALTRLMTNLLFGVGATDPLTFIGISLLLAFVTLLACWLPARRAARVDPMVALRYE